MPTKTATDKKKLICAYFRDRPVKALCTYTKIRICRRTRMSRVRSPGLLLLGRTGGRVENHSTEKGEGDDGTMREEPYHSALLGNRPIASLQETDQSWWRNCALSLDY